MFVAGKRGRWPDSNSTDAVGSSPALEQGSCCRVESEGRLLQRFPRPSPALRVRRQTRVVQLEPRHVSECRSAEISCPSFRRDGRSRRRIASPVAGTAARVPAMLPWQVKVVRTRVARGRAERDLDVEQNKDNDIGRLVHDERSRRNGHRADLPAGRRLISKPGSVLTAMMNEY